jgi:hypothetical protein
MINICIDGNNIFHKTFGVFAGYGSVDPAKILAKKSDQSMFIRKVATDLCASLKNLPTGGRLIFTMDSRSWRKNIEIENGGYKSNRIKDENVDWSLFFSLMEDFGLQLEKQGFIFSKVDMAEGDDLLYYWSEYFNKTGENCIIISGDKDMHQLVRFSDEAWTVIWTSNSKKNIVTAYSGWKENWLESEDPVSIFDVGSAISSDKEKLKALVSKCQYDEINTLDFITNKIMIGDDGDAVPSVWEIKDDGKTRRFTQSKSNQLLDAIKTDERWKGYSFSEMLRDEDFTEWSSGYILRVMKDIDSSENRKKVKENLIRNYKLMFLDASAIPEEVISNMSDEIQRGISLPRKGITLDRIKILDGSSWVSANFQPSSFDPFADLL